MHNDEDEKLSEFSKPSSPTDYDINVSTQSRLLMSNQRVYLAALCAALHLIPTDSLIPSHSLPDYP